MLNPELCKGCPLDGKFIPAEPQGPEDARFLIVSEVPSAQGAAQGRLIPPTHLQAVAEEMRDIGLGKDDFRIFPACRCPYNPDDYKTKEKTAIHKQCRQHLLDEIEELQPEVVIPLGGDAATQCFGRATKIMKCKGRPHWSEDLQSHVFPLQSPKVVTFYPQNRPIFRADVQSLGRFIDAGFDPDAAKGVEHGEYELITDLQFLIDANPEVLAFDTENTSLRWYKEGVNVRAYKPEHHKGNPSFDPRFQILTMQFCIEEGKAYMLVWDHPEAPIKESDKARLRNQLRQLLCNPDTIVVGQNLKYDNLCLWMKEGIRFPIGGDTLMLATLLDENAQQKGLDILTKLHVEDMAGYSDEFDNEVDKKRMWEESIDSTRAYGCGDADATFRLYHELEPKVMEDEKLWAHYCRVSIPGLNAFAAMEARGMYIDEEFALPDFQAFMEIEVAREYESLLRQVPKEIKRDHLAAAKGNVPAEKTLAFSRTAFVKDILFTHPAGFKLKPVVFTKGTAKLTNKADREPSTSSKDHLPYFHDTCPFTVELGMYMQDKRLLDTNVVGFHKKYVVSGKVRPRYSLTKAVTGRTASEDPNGQNYPKRSKKAARYRQMFVAPEGYFICELDLSQAELRIAASMAGDPTMIKIYKDGGDIHRATALIVAGLSEAAFDLLPKKEQKELRQKAKAVNFGFLYGMGWRKFIGYAKTQYNAVFTEDEAQRVRAGFFKKYSRLDGWHKKMREFARNNGFVRSFSGRIRHLPMIASPEEFVRNEAERQGINSPVQEFGSSLGVMALGRMDYDLNPAHLQIVGFIHDAIVFYVKKEYLDWGLRTVKTYMQTNPLEEWFDVKLPVPIIADCGFGHSLGEIHECDGFDLKKPFDYTTIKDKEGNVAIEVPPQRIPPNNGRLLASPYTKPDEREPEDGYMPQRRMVRRVTRTRAESVELPVRSVRRHTRIRAV